MWEPLSGLSYQITNRETTVCSRYVVVNEINTQVSPGSYIVHLLANCNHMFGEHYSAHLGVN